MKRNLRPLSFKMSSLRNRRAGIRNVHNRNRGISRLHNMKMADSNKQGSVLSYILDLFMTCIL